MFFKLIAFERLGTEGQEKFIECGVNGFDSASKWRLTPSQITLSKTVITMVPLLSCNNMIEEEVDYSFQVLKAFRQKQIPCRVWIFPDLDENRTFSQNQRGKKVKLEEENAVMYCQTELKIKERFGEVLNEFDTDGLLLAGRKKNWKNLLFGFSYANMM